MNDIFYNEHFQGLVARYTEIQPTLSSAADMAVRAYWRTRQDGLDTYTVTNAPPVNNMGELMHIIEDEAGIKELNFCIAVADYMRCLHYLLNNGWKVAGPFEKRTDYGIYLGLRMKKD